jgi:hypothetical protein
VTTAPESSINQACEDWAETKAAYRFFKNDNVEWRDIVDAHSRKTAIRASNYETVLAIQDTSYFVYTSHPNTKGLGLLGSNKGKNKKEVPANGLLMHSCLAVTTEGTPLGLPGSENILPGGLSGEEDNNTRVTRSTAQATGPELTTGRDHEVPSGWL